MKNLKIAVAVILLLCLLHLPYGYYIFVRFAMMLVFSVLAYLFFTNKQNILGIISIGGAILFQPFCKIALGRTMWNIVDVIVAMIFIVWWLMDFKENK